MQEQFLEAASQGNLPTVQWILQQPGGVNVNAGDQDGLTALHFAVCRGSVAIVQAILQVEGVNVNARTISDFAPLHLACFSRHANQLPILRALLEAGANPNAADDNGDTPLFFVARHSNIRRVEALLDAGADPAARNRYLDTPLHRACFWGQLGAAQLLIQRQGSECLTLKNNREESPLDRLVQNRSIRLRVKGSIRKHIIQAYAGMIAQRDGHLCLHSVLQDAAFTVGADDEADEEFELPVGKLNTEHLQKLLEYIIAIEPGSLRALDRDGRLPWQVATQLNFPDLVLYILLRPYPEALLLFR